MAGGPAKRKLIVVALSFIFAGMATGARADLDGFLHDVNVQARTDMHNFAVRVAAQFGVPEAQVQAVITRVGSPADVFMVFQIGHWTGRAPGDVVAVYSANQGRGWGVIARQMGIRPGSAEFHALRRGDLVFSGRPGASPERAAGKGRGRGWGKAGD